MLFRGLTCAMLLAMAGIAAHAQDIPQRKEAKRADLTGVPGNMEVITSITEYKKGERVIRHFHNGIEAAYIIQGTMIQRAGQGPSEQPTGMIVLNPRDLFHGDYVVVGDTPLRMFTVHVVDKGKPLYDTSVK